MKVAPYILTWFSLGFAANAATAPKIFIDAGHGGRDDGACDYSILEKDVSLSLARLVQSSLQKLHFGEVKLSRNDNRFLSLTERVTSANRWGADVFVSLHANSSPFAKARGYEIYFLSTEASDAAAKDLARVENGDNAKVGSAVQYILNDVETNVHISESSRLADVLFAALSGKVPNARAIRQAPFAVLEGTTMPAVLIEMGYVTNKDDARNLAKPPYLKRLADAISSGIINFLQRDALYEIRHETRQKTSESTSSGANHA